MISVLELGKQADVKLLEAIYRSPWLLDDACGLMALEGFASYPVGTVRRWVKGYVQKQADGKWHPMAHDAPGVEKAGHSARVTALLAEIDKIFSVAKVLPPPPPKPTLVIPPPPQPPANVSNVKATDGQHYDAAKEGQRKMLKGAAANEALDKKNGTEGEKLGREDFHKAMNEVKEELDEKFGKPPVKPASMEVTKEDTEMVGRSFNLKDSVGSLSLMGGPGASGIFTPDEIKKARDAAQAEFGDGWDPKLKRAWQKRAYTPGQGFSFPEAMTKEELDYEKAYANEKQKYQELANELSSRKPEALPMPVKWTPTAKKAGSGNLPKEMEMYQRLVGPSLGPTTGRKTAPTPVKIGKKGHRGHFVAATGELNVGVARSGIILHEMGHQLEHQNGRVADASRHFLEARTSGEDAQRMSTVTGNSSYGSSEITRKDKFIDPYVGKAYEGARSTEVIAMGLEQMTGEGAVLAKNMQNFREKDPEHFALMYGVMTGKFGHRE